MINKRSDYLFYSILGLIGWSYLGFILLLLLADVLYMLNGVFAASANGKSWMAILAENPIITSLGKEEIRYAIKLTLASCSITAILSVIVAVPTGYLLSRKLFPWNRTVDAIMDIPIVLPPLVVGLSLLILFQFWPFTIKIPGTEKGFNEWVVYQIPAVILAQFSVATAFAIRTMKVAFDQLNPRCEAVALTLGCTRFQAFFRVVLPDVRKGIFASATIAWARALGEFGPLLVFAGATRRKTEVLSTTVFLELSIGNLEAAVAVSLYMVLVAIVVLLLIRHWGDGVL